MAEFDGMARLLEDYKSRIRGELQADFDVKNVMAIPALRKVVVSMGTGSPGGRSTDSGSF